MKGPWITGVDLLRERLAEPAQLSPAAPESALPDYLTSFLGHVRLLVGVPFEYLVPDPRFLPEESIRFFYVDRSWTDRLTDGVFAVGKVGSREQAHHQAQEPDIRPRLDRIERVVRALQRGSAAFADARASAESDPVEAETTTGFLMRSAAVATWPDMEVRAYVRRDGGAMAPLRTLRLEKLGTSLLLALFEGVPDRVICEEPHHGMSFGFEPAGLAGLQLRTRGADGQPVPGAPAVIVPFRAGNHRVLAVAELRRRLHARHTADPAHVPAQTGAAAFGVAVMAPPWRQRFEGNGGAAPQPSGALAQPVRVAERSADPALHALLTEIVHE